MSDEESRSLAVKAAGAVFMVLASVTVILRCYVRAWLVKGFGWDDGAMVIAALLYIMFCGCMIGGSLYGTGYKFENLTAHERVTAMKVYWWLCEVAYCFVSIACKISVCIFLMRITVRRVYDWILYIVMVLTVLAGLVFLFVMLLQCKPVSYFWTRTALDPAIEGRCINTDIVVTMTYVYSAFAGLCDFTVGTLPIFLVRKLQMKRETKLAVIGILSMACIASSAVIIRFPFVKTFKDPDFLYATVQVAVWSNIEAGLGITAGSLATLRPLLRHWFGSQSGPYYSTQPPRVSHTHRVGSAQRPVQLESIDGTLQSDLRPDKLAVMVTNVECQRDGPSAWTRSSSPGNSEEGLNADHSRIEVGIHRTFEVTQTIADGDDVESARHDIKEHL
ncbi:hypothetical protein N7492_000440 [Penicillium capsulatum]|uniref:Rhodopsin domain-containing protein n=1 Tax=Penicillium capsulatum TaxID=69766 RepID=A0A9W9IRS2_9EURO|nr:hypothetical protein N7492_000440 [Penicillium capsulatum]KAJ6130498.1 hypothetical protein N7512_003278 [Penicillium capsulatum]